MISTVKVGLKGTSALLMHAFPLIPLEAAEKKSPQEQAEHAAYRDPDTNHLYVPGVNVQRALVAAASYSKGKGRASLQKPVAACVVVSPERISLDRTEFTIDSRAVVIAATKGRIVRHRPRIDDWHLEFEIEFDDRLISEKQLRQVVDNMGSQVGLLDFRPERKGPFGRSMVVSWEGRPQENGKAK